MLLSRNEGRAHKISIRVKFLGDNGTIIWNDTYIHTESSSAAATNRAIYSGQMYRHLLNLRLSVIHDGDVLDTIDLFRGTMNDASITENSSHTCDSRVQWYEESDIMSVNRDFGT